jgi:hypothetical protein
MKSRSLKFFQILLASIVMVSGSAYACTGSESCSMPCCRQSVKDTNPHGAAGSAEDCCKTANAAASEAGTACRLAAKDFAANPEIRTYVGLSACSVATSGEAWIGRTSFRAPALSQEPIPEPIPIFLQVQALLI